MDRLQEAQIIIGQMYITINRYTEHTKRLESRVESLVAMVKELEEKLAAYTEEEKQLSSLDSETI